MGRARITIRRLESWQNRQITYSKRRPGLLKKAKELSILCDIDIALVMISPSGILSSFHGERSNLEQVITKYAQVRQVERTHRKLETLEALKKRLKEIDHDVNIDEFMGSSPSPEILASQVDLLQAKIAAAENSLSLWRTLDQINNVEQLQEMESSLCESLNQIRLLKGNLEHERLMSPDISSQFQDGMNMPLMTSNLQESQPLLWNPSIGIQQMMLHDDLNLLPHRDMTCNLNASLHGPSNYYGDAIAGMDNAGQYDNTRPECSSLNEQTANACMGVPSGDTYTYSPYTNTSILEEQKMMEDNRVNLQDDQMDYQIAAQFDMPTSIYDTSITMADNRGNFQGNQMDYQIAGQFDTPTSIGTRHRPQVPQPNSPGFPLQ
ncbi:agamous-like MADS-box protein AGL65 isoform X2 [Amaranthus tricolor]|uniref:agamous-like MADS-box protein AGL65 isoform X2 n=1 Tax=Amaranthus tricolor TaxID=29722 RepID=UPI002584E1A4|nr:agamous-like MADS-box protein AGL65 isoform X2 [Amaranthus tricolor]